MEVVDYLIRAVFLSSERSNTFILFSYNFNDLNSYLKINPFCFNLNSLLLKYV